MNEVWEIAVPAPLPALTYTVPPEFLDQIRPGASVEVGLRGRSTFGVALRKAAPPDASLLAKLKPIRGFHSERAPLSSERLNWIEWLAQYYRYRVGLVAELSFPPLPRTSKRPGKKRAILPEGTTAEIPELNREQRAAVESIDAVKGFSSHLLYGVTGSGKTEVYLQLAHRLRERGRQTLVIVPEISLTPQLVARFVQREGNAVAVLHSHLTPREKTNEWWKAVSAEAAIVIGARSALFCPIPNLGLIVVDEEHEPSLKQEESLRYHARDAAIMLAKYLDIPVVLGSATPSLETWHGVRIGRCHIHRLPSRVSEREMPVVTVVDLREVKESKRLIADPDAPPYWMSEPLREMIIETLSRGEQTALFLNRRGVAPSVVCSQCGAVAECPNCAVSLTLHGKSQMVCHYCEHIQTMSSRCRDCGTGEPRPLGLGTEQVEGDLRKLFPAARLLRMDRDEISSRQDLEAAISAMEKREVDILVGTQMIAKGLDFEGLTSVGIILADIALQMPDFRAGERAFQLFTQVAGRAGRHLDDRPGKVIIQTYNPDHPSVRFARDHDFEAFAEYELIQRADLSYPPAARLLLGRVLGASETEVEQSARRLVQWLREKSTGFGEAMTVLGPAPSPLARLRGDFRFQFLIKSPDARSLSHAAAQLEVAAARLSEKVRLVLDIDPIHLL